LAFTGIILVHVYGLLLCSRLPMPNLGHCRPITVAKLELVNRPSTNRQSTDWSIKICRKTERRWCTVWL